MRMHPVPSDSLDTAWGRVAPHLRKFREKYPEWTMGEMYDLLSEAKRQLYIVLDEAEVAAVVITQISEDGKTMEVPIVSGTDAKDWAGGVLWNLEDMARKNGIENILLRPRPGWIKELELTPSAGWKEVQRIYEKRL